MRNHRHKSRPPAPRGLGLVLCAALLGMIGAGAAPPRAQAAAPQNPAAPLESALRELDRLLGERAALRAEQRKAESAAAQATAEIEKLKGEPASVTRDLQLQGRLAQAEAQAQDLSRRAASLRLLDNAVTAARRQVVARCDQLLGTAPGTLQRVELLRLRAAQVDALASDGADRRGALDSAQHRGAPLIDPQAVQRAAREDGDDDPQVLRERADLLRDSADKIRRELARLDERGEELARRRKLQERAAAVDDDLFAEQAVNRRARDTSKASAADAAPPVAGAGAPRDNGTGGSFGTPTPTPTGAPTGTPPTAPTPLSPFLNGVDPATLDLLRSGAEPGGADPEARLRALRRAQGELRRLLDAMGKRAAALEQRSSALQRQK